MSHHPTPPPHNNFPPPYLDGATLSSSDLQYIATHTDPGTTGNCQAVSNYTVSQKQMDQAFVTGATAPPVGYVPPDSVKASVERWNAWYVEKHGGKPPKHG